MRSKGLLTITGSNLCTPAKLSLLKELLKTYSPSYVSVIFSARGNMYISRLCYDVSVRLSVRLPVYDGSALAHYS